MEATERALFEGGVRRATEASDGAALDSALAALGDVYLEHEMATDALAAYKEAVALEPTNLGYEKALAAA